MSAHAAHELLVDEDGPTTETWRADAACIGEDVEEFFPERGETTALAKSVCGVCLVRVDCLQYALVTGQKFGIWGGTSERERRRMRRGLVKAGRLRPLADELDVGLTNEEASSW